MTEPGGVGDCYLVDANPKARELWDRFCHRLEVGSTSVPLFDCDDDGVVRTAEIGKVYKRPVLRRSAEMEKMIISAGDVLVGDFLTCKHDYDGLLYMMHWCDGDGSVVPLHIGKAESMGRGGGNLAASLMDLHGSKRMFAKWGSGYAYHVGDLSAAALPRHEKKHHHRRYREWAETLFEEVPSVRPRLKREVFFWCKPWRGTDVGIWEEFGATKLTFQEYLMIGLASAVFADVLLNREVRIRG